MQKKHGLIIIAACVLVIAVAIGVYGANHRTQSLSQLQQEAIRQARAYKPEGFCTQSLVPAVHRATGARYTFPSGCLAPGWEAER
ncbi:MAG TPA: hypothetical protein VLI54_03905 [Bacillota bacterium]|nr:hypothetical protein [Bacillota bacterium]